MLHLYCLGALAQAWVLLDLPEHFECQLQLAGSFNVLHLIFVCRFGRSLRFEILKTSQGWIKHCMVLRLVRVHQMPRLAAVQVERLVKGCIHY